MVDKTIKEHLKELGKYFLVNFILFIIVFFVIFTYLLPMVFPLFVEYYQINVVSFAPFEYLSMQMKIAAVLAGVFIFPAIVYSFYLYCREFVKIQSALLLILNAYVLGLIGFFLGITYVSKAILDSMLEITPVETIWNVTSVFSLVGTTGLVLALTLELLIIIPILVKIGLIEYKSYSIKRKYILFILFLAIAVLTPDPTLYSTVILFFPAMLSIEAGFMIGKFYENKETKGLNTHTHKNLDERNKM